MKITPFSAALTIGVFAAGASQFSIAEDGGPHTVTANFGVVSNYIWRGQTQTDNQPAIQGGIDYNHSSGLYAKTWVSNVDFGAGDQTNYEFDLTAGFGNSINDDLSYDFNLIYVSYPDVDDIDFAELGGSVTFKWLTAGLNYTIYGQADNYSAYDVGDMYYHAALDFELLYNLGLNLHAGYYDFDAPNVTDYTNWGISISRSAGDFGTVSLNYDQVDSDTEGAYDEDPKIWIGWNKTF
ncbi:hypothetical protein CKO09_07895 [Chromatium weissei]|nr:hypothetical protein [Chromatium weissei]